MLSEQTTILRIAFLPAVFVVDHACFYVVVIDNYLVHGKGKYANEGEFGVHDERTNNV